MAMTANGSYPIPADAPTNPPPGWGEDELTKFLDGVRNGQWATFVHLPAARKLIEFDAQFMKASENWMNPQSEITALLLIRCHAAFRAASSLAMAGQVAETYVLCRAILEYAAYAVHVYRDPLRETVWLNRHQDAETMKTQKAAFSYRKVLDSVVTANIHVGGRFEKLYQHTIDFGAHPNERAVTGNMRMRDETGGKTTITGLMLEDDLVVIDRVLKSVAQCGITSLEMLQVVFKDRFEQLGIDAAMFELRKEL